MVNPKLIHSINTGRCYVLVGSGPSTEVGYASWGKLASDVYGHLLAEGAVTDKAGYENSLSRGEYPELLRQAEIDIGGRGKLCDLLRLTLAPQARQRGRVYEYLTRWPFACYLTTNFDNEIHDRLASGNVHYQTLGNDAQDLSLVARDGAAGFIVKLHSDLDNPARVVVTSQDYDRLYVAPEGYGFRKKLEQIFSFFPLLIVGHSLKDRDLDYVLRLARQYSSEEHPIFMVAADFTPMQVREYRERYNIDVVTYANPDGFHRQLASLLAAADKFVTPRAELTATLGRPPSEDEAATAASMFVYRNLRRARRMDDTTAAELLGPLILRVLSGTHGLGATMEELAGDESFTKVIRASREAEEALAGSLQGLQKSGLVEQRDLRYAVTSAGEAAAREVALVRSSQREQALGQFRLDLKAAYPDITSEASGTCASLLEKTVTDVYSRRGLAVANSIFAMQRPTREEMLGIFEAISNSAAVISDGTLRAAYADTAFKLLVEPSTAQRDYLAALSQGYFLYHWLGLDPRLSTARQTFIRNALWVCDSSVLLPLVADGCGNHAYAVDFLKRLRQAALYVVTTDRLLQEAWEHFEWALRFVRSNPTDSPEFLAAALSRGQYKQNLFIDGYIRSSPRGGVGSFEQYMRKACPQGENKPAFVARFAELGFHPLKLESLEGFKLGDVEDAVRHTEKVREARVTAGTMRSLLQVEAEGEVLQIVLGIRGQRYRIPGLTPEPNSAYFVSQSAILDRVAETNHVITFAPGSLYKYLVSMQGEVPDPALLHQCMQGEYFDAGASFVDAKLYKLFFAPLVDSAKHSLAEQLRMHIEDFSDEERRRLGDAFQSTPDLEKPFFVLQVGWHAASRAQARAELADRRAESAVHRAEKAEAVAKKAAKAGDLSELKKERRLIQQEANRLRNLQDPAIAKKLVRQRKAKSRKKKRG